jgi:hypothetical protein
VPLGIQEKHWTGDNFPSVTRDSRGLSRARPFRFFLTDFARNATAIALTLAVIDVISGTFLNSTPLTRLAFIVLWAVLMSTFNLWRNRRVRG